jgi:hypothetical protein
MKFEEELNKQILLSLIEQERKVTKVPLKKIIFLCLFQR